MENLCDFARFTGYTVDVAMRNSSSQMHAIASPSLPATRMPKPRPCSVRDS